VESILARLSGICYRSSGLRLGNPPSMTKVTMKRLPFFLTLLLLCTSCASYDKRDVVDSRPTPPNPAAQAPTNLSAASSGTSSRILKRKVAVARFTNEARIMSSSLFGEAYNRDPTFDRLGKQAADMLSTELTRSGKFIVLERQDLNKLEAESELMGLSREQFKQSMVGVDALIFGSVAEFGRKDVGEVQMFSRSRQQIAHAKVNARLVDPRTGHAFFSDDGAGDATLEQSTILGLGDRATFDSTLNDKALSAAIVNLIDKLINKLADKPWTTSILTVEGANVIVSGGSRQGLRAGDHLKVMTAGKVIKSPQTGFNVQLPNTQVGELEVLSFFGDSETNEGSICKIVNGPTPTTDHMIQF
jgi:curli biogenesis system outer membrane secretion channel CsgG